MAILKFSNNALTTLAAGISAIDTTIELRVGTGALFPTISDGDHFIGTLSNSSGTLNEIVNVTARSGDTLTVVRAQEGSTAQIWTTGTIFENLVTAGSMAAMVQTSVQDLPRVLAPGTITGGDATGLSGAIQTDGVSVMGIQMPAAWTSAVMTFKTSIDDVTYQNVYDQYGNEFSIIVSAGVNVILDSFTYFYPANYVKVRSGTNGTPVTQGADRIINLMVGA